MEQKTSNSKIIRADAEKIYKALTDAEALETWQAPGNMTAKVHSLDLRVGGGYEMSLYYPPDEAEMQGKTTGKEDRFRVKFLSLDTPRKIVEAVNFYTDDPAFMGEMILKIELQPTDEGTRVTFSFSNIPNGIKPGDNEAGTISSLNKLAKYVAQLDRN